MGTRFFSLDEAQALVPQVRRLLGQALQLHGHLRVAIARLSEAGYEVTWAMLRGQDPLRAPIEDDTLDPAREREASFASNDGYGASLDPGLDPGLDPDLDPEGDPDPSAPARDPRAEQALERTRMIYTTLRETVAAIESLGVEVKGVVDGLIDFHSWCDGEREVLLCWKLGEAEISFFHATDEGFASRQPIHGHRFTATPERQPEIASK